MRNLLTSAVLLAALVTASASGQTSALTGTTTIGRVPVAGVHVAVTSPALQGVRSMVTGATGSYHFIALPPGIYAVAFRMQGMETVNKTAHLSLSRTSTVDVDLDVARFSVELTVTREPRFSTSAPGLASSFSGEEVDLLPAERDVLSIAALAAGVNLTSLGVFKQPAISGGPGYDNLIMVNGAAITNSDGTLHSLFIEDAIQETTVLTGGISAEFGRFTGGVVNALTKSGGNQWSGSFRDSVSNPKWTTSTPYPVPAVVPDSIDHVLQETLGGFVVRDRLWFFMAGRQWESSRPRLTTSANVPYVNKAAEVRYEAKLTGRLLENHTIVGSFLHLLNRQTNGTFNRVYDLDSLINPTFPQSILALHYDGIFRGKLLLEAQHSRKRFANKGNGSPFTDIIRGTPIVDRTSGTRLNSATNCGVCGDRTTYNEAYVLKASQFVPSDRFGDHTVIGGMEYFSEHRTINNYLSGSGFTVFASAVQIVGSTVFPRFLNDGTAFIRWTPVLRQSHGNDLATISGFVNDQWKVNERINANIGLRYDRNRAVDADGARVSNDHALSPRLGVVYDLAGDGKHHISAGLSRYVSDMTDGRIGGAGETAGVSSQIDFAYRGPDLNPRGLPPGQLLTSAEALRLLFDWFQQQCDLSMRCGTSNLSLLRPGGLRETPGFFAQVGDRLASPSVDEMFVGYGLQPARSFSARFTAVQRKWSDFYNYRVDGSTPRAQDSFGIDHDVAVVENTNDIKRLYRSVQVQVQWRPSRVGAGLTYTWSTLRGNDEQENQEVRAVPNAALGTYYPELLSYANRLPIGYLSQDQRHRARAWLGYDVRLAERIGHLNVSILQSFDSGRRYSARGIIKTIGYAGAPANLYYTGGIPDDGYYFSRRGAFKLKSFTQTDLALTYRRPLRRAEVFLQADLLNVLNQAAVISVDTTVLTAANSSGLKTFNPFMEKPVEGTHYRLGPLFGQPRGPDSYQRPRTYQFSAGMRF